MLAGLLIGIGVILPGVSGAVIAVALGIYDKLILSLTNFKKDKKNNTLFLLKIGIGLIIGVIISSRLILYFFNKYNIEMSYLFIGLILGTIPLIIKEYKNKTKDKLNIYIIVVFAVLSFAFSLIIKNDLVSTNENNIVLLFLSGFLFAIGKIIPGLSSSVLLNMIGRYNLFLNVLSNPIDYMSNNLINILLIKKLL